MNRNCTACQTPLTFRGKRRFFATNRVESNSDDVELAIEFYDVYVCSQCSRIEFFLPESEITAISDNITVEEQRPSEHNLHVDSRKVSDEIILGEQKQVEIADLLKIKPSQSDQNNVIQELGTPARKLRYSQSHTMFQYTSAPDESMHTILIDSAGIVSLIAIYNQHHQFTAENLREAYGEPELATVIDGREHWIFEWHGVALVAQGRDEDDILYVQFFDPKINLDRYLEADGFAEETFYED